MQRIYDPSASATLPAPPPLTGVLGYFTGATPGTVAATRVRYWYLNMLQDELMSLLAAAGITPDTTATNFTQVLAALHVLFGGVGSLTSPGSMTLPGGLILEFGQGTVPASGSSAAQVAVTFPNAFPTSVLAIAGAAQRQANSTLSGGYPTFSAYSPTVNGFTLVLDSLGYTTFNQTVTAFWAAIGK